MMKDLIVAAFFVMLHTVCAHKDGAPLQACLTMTPEHPGTSPQLVTSPNYRIGFSQIKPNLSATVLHVVTLSGDVPFKGFFVQARSHTNGDVNPIGTWNFSASFGLAKGVDCGGITNSAATHVTNDPKPRLILIWIPPDGFSGSLNFLATVVQDFRTYWVGVNSAMLTLDGSSSSHVVDGSVAPSTPSQPRSRLPAGDQVGNPLVTALDQNQTGTSPGAALNKTTTSGSKGPSPRDILLTVVIATLCQFMAR